MMTHPDFDKVWRGQRGMRAGIRSCARAKCVVSVVTLVYCAIDAIAGLTRETQESGATRKEFVDWVHTYLLPELSVSLSSLDVYAARCGVVHTHAPTSNLSQRGHAKLIVYKWRHGHRPDDPVLEERAQLATVIEIEDLIEGLDRAVRQFERKIGEDAQLRDRVERNITDLLCYEPWHPVAITVAA